MSPSRRCTRPACTRAAVATLTYVYADQTAVLGPLATYAEPHSYDLCESHAERLSVPRGWQVLRLARDRGPAAPTDDDLLALADAVREAGRPAGPAPARDAARGRDRTADQGADQGAGRVADGSGSRHRHLRTVRADEAGGPVPTASTTTREDR